MSESLSQAPATGPRRGLRGPLVLLGVFAVMGTMTVGAVVLPTLALGTGQAPLEVYGTMPAFRLQDQTGAALSDDALTGHVVIASFIFTRCPTVCPLLTMKMRRIQDRTADAGERIKLISFSVDPSHDTPEVLAEYAAGHGADPRRWRFLTGPMDDIRRISDGLMLALDIQGQLPNGAPDVVHAEHFVLLDAGLRIRGFYDAGDAKRMERLVHDAHRLLKAGSTPAPRPQAAQ